MLAGRLEGAMVHIALTHQAQDVCFICLRAGHTHAFSSAGAGAPAGRPQWSAARHLVLSTDLQNLIALLLLRPAQHQIL